MIVTALEFLTAAFSYLECQVVYSALFQHDGNASTSIDNGGNCNKNYNDRDGRNTKDILKTLVYLFLNEQELRNEDGNTNMFLNNIIPTVYNHDADTTQTPMEQNPQQKTSIKKMMKDVSG